MNEPEVERLLRSTTLEPAPVRRARPWRPAVVAAGLLMAAAVLMAVLAPRERPVEGTAPETADGNRTDPKPVRVLYVEGPPRYEFRFLKNALLRDPSVLLHAFLLTADDGFPQEHTKSTDPLFRQPLVEFPPDLKSLLQYNVLILGDVDPAKLGPGAADRIVQFVADFGGGVVFISGMNQSPRAYGPTPLARLLPVIPDDAGKPVTSDLVYRLTEAGKASTLTSFPEFRGDRDKAIEHWEDRDGKGDGLKPVRGCERVKRVKAGATVLVEVLEGKTPHPLFVTSQVGRGRVFWSATDETWLWRYLTGDSPWFLPFWRQAIDWAREPQLKKQ